MRAGARGRARAGGRVRRRLTDPLLPVLLLGPVLLDLPVLTWAVLGGLAGYSLSGSV